jgi:hypothetical protein
MGSSIAQTLARAAVLPSQQTLLPNPFLYTLPEELWDKAKDQFGYTANFLPVPANGTLTVQTNIQSDSAFIIVSAVATVTNTAETQRQAFASALVQIQDQTSGRNFYDQPTHFHNVFGTAEQPAWWQIPRLVYPSSTLSTTIQNLDTANARNFRVLYLGFKVFGIKVQK